MKSDDFENIREIELEDYSKCILELYKQNFSINSNNISQKDFCNYIINKRKSNHKTFVLEHKLKIIGIGTCFIEPKLIYNFRNVCHIEDIIIDTDFHNKGLENKYVHSSPGYVWPNTLPYDDCTGHGCEGILV